MTKQTSQEAISLFVGQLIGEKKFENLDAEIVKQMKNDLTERVEDRINASILEHMPPSKLEEFDEILNSEDEKKIQLFCQDNIPGLDNILAKELMEFRNTYLNS